MEDVADEITVGYVGSMTSEYVDEGVPFLRSLNIEPFGINMKDLKYITSDFHKKISKSKLYPEDVVIVRTGKPGTCTVIPDWLKEANCSDLVIIRPNSELDPYFLASYVNSVATHHVYSHLVGAVQQHFNVGSARRIKMLLPPLQEQKAIVGIIKTINNKITINNAINKNLEEIAQALFKRWFVDFEFPNENGEPYRSSGGEFEESELGLIPKGWEVFSLGEICKISTKTINPSSYPDTTFEHYSIPAFDDGRIPVFESGSEIKSNKYIVSKRSILVSKLNPETKRIWNPYCLTERSICSTEFINYVPLNPELRAYCYSILNSEQFTQYLASNTTGSTNSRQRANPKTSLNYKLLYGGNEITQKFNEIVSDIYEKISENILQSRNLSSIRDALLPKLMSGEIRVLD